MTSHQALRETEDLLVQWVHVDQEATVDHKDPEEHQAQMADQERMASQVS